MKKLTIGSGEENLANGYPYVSAFTSYGGVSSTVHGLVRKKKGEMLVIEAGWSDPRQVENPKERVFIDLVVNLGFLWGDEAPIRFEIEKVLPVQVLYPFMRYRWEDFVPEFQDTYLADVVAQAASISIRYTPGELEVTVEVGDWVGTGRVPFTGILTKWARAL